VLPWIELSPRTLGWIHRGQHGLLLVAFFWALFRVVDVVAEGLRISRWSQDHSASRALIPLGTRVAKVGLAAASVVTLLAELGYPVASLLAGLGIGGLAVALAARSTLENLFGAFSIGADQPFREGDVVKVEDFVGTVEAVGLRSTRIRTLDRTLISLPNGKLADMKVESLSARDRIRLACTVGLVYETTAQQMRAVLGGLESVLRKHPKIWPDSVVVRFKELAASSLDIEVMAWFLTRDWGEFQSIRQEILLQFMEVVAAAGTSFAFPTQTVHVAADTPPNRSAVSAPGQPGMVEGLREHGRRP
jgi:MscS family membrane protein